MHKDPRPFVSSGPHLDKPLLLHVSVCVGVVQGSAWSSLEFILFPAVLLTHIQMTNVLPHTHLSLRILYLILFESIVCQVEALVFTLKASQII